MNTAQQVRVWVGVSVGVLLALCCFGMVGSLTSVNDFNGTGNTALFTTNSSGFFASFALALVCLAAEGILAGFTIYRIYRPLQQRNPQAQVPWQASPQVQAPWQASPQGQAPWQASPQAQAPRQASPQGQAQRQEWPVQSSAPQGASAHGYAAPKE